MVNYNNKKNNIKNIIYNLQYCYLEKNKENIEDYFLIFKRTLEREIVSEYGKLKGGGIEEKITCRCFGIIVDGDASLRVNFEKRGNGCRCKIWEINKKNKKLVKKYFNKDTKGY